MSNKELLYKKLLALRLEVHGSIVDDIKSTVDSIFQEQNLQQSNNSGSFPYPVNIEGEYIDVSFKEGVYQIKQLNRNAVKSHISYENNELNTNFSQLPLSTEILTECYHILFDRNYKKYWTERDKAREMGSIIKGNIQPCRPFENWFKVVNYLLSHSSK